MSRLHGRTALITGAARGIGRAFAQAYVREGARVAICDIDFDKGWQWQLPKLAVLPLPLNWM